MARSYDAHRDARHDAEAEPQAEVEPFVVFSPAQHPPAVFRVLKQAFRDYQASGNAAAITLTTPPTQSHSAVLPVSGNVQVDIAAGVPLPPSVTVSLTQSATVKGTQAAPVDQVTGNFTTTFPINTLAAGTATATAATVAPVVMVETVTTPAFTLT